MVFCLTDFYAEGCCTSSSVSRQNLHWIYAAGERSWNSYLIHVAYQVKSCYGLTVKCKLTEFYSVFCRRMAGRSLCI